MNIYGVIGDPIRQSRSPLIHNYLLAKLAINSVYIPLHITDEQLENAVAIFRNNLSGFNVTIPHKENIIPYLDELDVSATLYGAVNTVKNIAGRLKGYNTDGYGFMRALHEKNYPIAGRQVLLLGAGGAARVVAVELLKLNCQITIAARTVPRGARLSNELQQQFPDAELTLIPFDQISSAKFDCIVNATPVGMGNLSTQLPLKRELLSGVELVYDLVYRKGAQVTPLLDAATDFGCLTIDGLPMLVYQGIRAAEIWLGQEITADLVQDIITFVMGE